MPASPEQAEGLARATVAIYADAEESLLRLISRRLAQGIDGPRWAETQLSLIGVVRREAARILAAILGPASEAASGAVQDAYQRGREQAIRDLEGLGMRFADILPGSRAAHALAREIVQVVTAPHQAILRAVVDVYRQVVSEVTGRVLLGAQTRRQVAAEVLSRLAGRGVTGFRDAAGRRWEAASYAEMAVRTASGRAAVQGHLERLSGAGLDLVIVSDAPQECIRCRPWEGKVLSISGVNGGAVQAENPATGRMVRVEVAGSVAQARLAGLQHANCRHSLSALLPGVTRIPTNTADPEGDRARQQLRYLERGVRAWKRRAAALEGLDEVGARRAQARARDWQARIREHTASTSAKRIPARERLGAR